MNQKELLAKWQVEKPRYEAWGEYIVRQVSQELVDDGLELGSFFKIQPSFRLKDDSSLVDKSFHRANKSYDNPYEEIEDKVGARFVVLLLSDIDKICEKIESNSSWVADACKHFNHDKEREPLLFTYQSVHYILRPKERVNISGVDVSTDTPCELQIRTLLQHAHAELTHDAIYKSKTTVRPKVHRTVAKSMALIETTDEFFTAVTEQLEYGPLEENGIVKQLDGLYLSLTGIKPHNQKSSLVIWDAFERFIDDDLINSIQSFLNKNSEISTHIKHRYKDNAFYRQSVVIFVYWLLKNRKNRLLADWPLRKAVLEPLGVDIGVTTFGS